MLTEEIDELRRRGIDISGLRISANAHLIMPYHLLLDQAGEAQARQLQIGTTRRGIGPCYADKAARLGIRVQDLLDEKILRKKIYAALEPKRLMLRPFAKDPSLDLPHDDRGVPAARPPARAVHRGHGADRLATPSTQGGLRACSRARRARCSTSTTAPIRSSPRRTRWPAPPASGAGVGPRSIDEVWGIAKAYATRVGAGPFPTELDDELGDSIREAGGEFGTTTGRARRTRLARPRGAALRGARERPHRPGDHQARRAHRHRPAARGRRYTGSEGASFEEFPYHQSILHKARGEPRRAARLARGHHGRRSIDELPRTPQDYLEFIERLPRRPDRAWSASARRRDEMIWTGGRARPSRRRVGRPAAALRPERRASTRPCRAGRGSRRPRAATGRPGARGRRG